MEPNYKSNLDQVRMFVPEKILFFMLVYNGSRVQNIDSISFLFLAECPINWSNIDGTCFSPPRKTSEFAEGRDCNSDCRVVKKLCTDDGANLATKEETHIWLNNGGDRLGKTYGLTSTMNGNRHWFTKNQGDYGWYAGCCHHTNRFFVCAKKSGNLELLPSRV